MNPFLFFIAAAFLFKKSKPTGIGSTDNLKEYTQFYHNAAAAVKFLMQVKEGVAVAALYHKDIGDIDIVWGAYGDDRNSGHGLAKIVVKHPEVIDALQSIITAMAITVVSKKYNQVTMKSNNYTAVIKLDYHGNGRRWLMTVFKKNKP